MEVVMAGDIVEVMAVPHPSARMIIKMAGIVPGMVSVPTAPAKIANPMADVSVSIMRPAKIDMVTGTGYMESEVTSLRFITRHARPSQSRKHSQC